jgi:hypothetical protein
MLKKGNLKELAPPEGGTDAMHDPLQFWQHRKRRAQITLC